MKRFPLQWPQGRIRCRHPEPARTNVSLASACDHCLHQLDLMGATHVILSSNAVLRKDKLPYSKQPKNIADVGVAVWFRMSAKPEYYCISCDQTDSIAGNVRAIGLAVGEIRGFTSRLGIKLAQVLSLFLIQAERTTKPPPQRPAPEPAPSAPPPPAHVQWEEVVARDGPRDCWQILGVSKITPWAEVITTYESKRQGTDVALRKILDEAFNEAKRKRGFKD